MALIGSVMVCGPATAHGAGMASAFGGGQSVTRTPKPLASLKNMLNSVELDQRRADFLETLYQEKGRNDQLFTGLWAEFKQCLATNFRDMDYETVRNDIIRATHSVDRSVAERNADVAITVLIGHLMEGWKQQ